MTKAEQNLAEKSKALADPFEASLQAEKKTSEHHEEHHHGHDEHGDHHHVSISAEEAYADYRMVKDLKFLYKKSKKTGLLSQLRDSLCTPKEVEPTMISERDYDALSRRQKRVRALLALEKLNAYNHHAFSAKEKMVLVPGNPTILHYLYMVGLSLGELWMVRDIFANRRFTLSRIGGTVAAIGFIEIFMMDFFYKAKEGVRIRKGLKLADQYLQKQDGRMAAFAKILHPHTSFRELEHYSLTN